MRRLVFALGIAAYFAGALVWLGQDPRFHKKAFDADSVHNSGPEGTSLAFEYLERRAGGQRVSASTLEVATARLEPDAVLFRIGPDAEVAPETADESAAFLTRAEGDWVRGGGRLVLAIDGDYRSLVVEAAPGAAVAKVFPTWTGVRTIAAPSVRTLSGDALAGGTSILSAGARPVAVRFRLGRGEVVVLSLPEIFRNDSLADGDHLALLEALSGRRPVAFDETVHGLGREIGTMDILRRWGLGPFLVLAVLAGLSTAWRRSRRLGPADHEAGESRREAVDLVDSLAVLYERGLTREKAIVLYREHLARAAQFRTGLAGEALEKWVANWIRSRAGPDLGTRRIARRAGFKNELERLNRAFRELEHVERR